LDHKLQANKIECHRLTKAIQWLEKVIKARTLTSDNFRNYGDDQVQRLKSRLAELEMEKETHIPEFIETMKKELLALWGELHIPVPPAADFPFVYNSPATKRTLVALESEVHRLQNLREHIAPMLDLIAIREDIISQYEKVTAVSVDPNRLTSRRGKNAGFLVEEERIRKRYSAELPKVHARLVPMLEEYEEMFGEPFLWDGEALLDAVNAMRRREEASLVQARARQSRKGSPKQKTARAALISQRGPFVLQEFMF
jgi:protein regulator of cytokinesis 1